MTKINIKEILLLSIIVLLALFLRLYKIATHPVSLSWDEVAIGYNAYAISLTGKDEYGRSFPLLFQSFNDYKLPGYIYIDALALKLLPLNEFTVRLPSAIFGTGAVAVIFFLTKKLFENSKLKLEIAHVSALMLAISPWHLHLSRAAFEANAALGVVLLGITLLVYGLKNKLAAILSLPTLSLALYFYYSPRLFVPTFLILFVLLFRKQIIVNLKPFAASFILSIALLVPVIIATVSPVGFKRVGEVSIFSDKSLITQYVNAGTNNQNPLSKIFLNRRIPIATEALHNYFSHLSPGFLFFGDDPNPRHHSTFFGNFYIFELASILLGGFVAFRLKDPKIKYTLLAWILIAPLPASLAKESPHTLRSLMLLPPLVILSSLGIANIWQNFRLRPLFVAFALFLFISYLYSYYLVYPIASSMSWGYGYKQMFLQIGEIERNFDRIIITGHYWKPYIYYLFYNTINPKDYQLNPNQLSVDKYRFGIAPWDTGGKDLTDELIESLKGTSTLLVISPAELEALEEKSRFTQISRVQDYSKKNTVFLIGQWQ